MALFRGMQQVSETVHSSAVSTHTSIPAYSASQLAAAPAYVQKLHAIRSEMDSTRAQASPPASFSRACVARQLHQPRCLSVNNSGLPQVESIKKRAQALKVAKQVPPTPHPTPRLAAANAYMRAQQHTLHLR